MTGRPRIGVSSCLLGEEVRFNGGHKRYRFLTDDLGPHADWVPHCPEVSIGLGTPRKPIRLSADGRLINKTGTADHTASMAVLAATWTGSRLASSRPNRWRRASSRAGWRKRCPARRGRSGNMY